MNTNLISRANNVLFVPGKGLVLESNGQVAPNEGTITNGLAAANIIQESLGRQEGSHRFAPFDLILFSGLSPENFPVGDTSEAREMAIIYKDRIDNLTVARTTRPEIVLDESSQTTFRNVSGLIQLWQDYGFEYVTVLSSRKHAERVKLIAEQTLGHAGVLIECIDSSKFYPMDIDYPPAFIETLPEIIKESLLRYIAKVSFIGVEVSDPVERLNEAEMRYERIAGGLKKQILNNGAFDLRGYGRS